jgi:sodium transport system ATP-binding protein
VLLDEPTNGLDVKSTRAMREFILSLKEKGKCILLTSHIMQEVAALCDQIVIISSGSVSAQGTSSELLRRTGHDNLEDAFIDIIGTEEGLQ